MASVYLQIGHYPRKTGSTGTGGEQELNKAVAGIAAHMLRARGHTVIVRGADDAVVKTDVFCAFHADGSVHPEAHGASVGYQDEAGQKLASKWKRAYQRLGWKSGFRQDNYTEALAKYYGVSRARSAGTKLAFIIEAGFLTNAGDAAELGTKNGRTRVAQALVSAIGAVVSHPEAKPKQPQPKRGKTATHTVKRGDTLWSIAQAYRMSLEELKQLNQLQGDLIREGDKLTVRT